MRLRTISLILFSLVLFACKGKKDVAAKPSHKFDQNISLGTGDSATFEDGLVFKLIRVTSDSRCPKGAQCVWEGEVTAVFTANKEEELTISSDPLKNPLKLGSYLIEFNKVLPIKEQKEIAQEEYTLNFKITKSVQP
jgi:hypothetical protein